MPTLNKTSLLTLLASLLLLASAANATTLTVRCGARSGLSSIGAALKILQSSDTESRGPSTINVSGACKENVVIQSMDRLTVNALNGASITDASGGTLDVIDIADSRSVSINNFTINAGADGATGANGISCFDGSLCRLNGDTVQGAADGPGIGVYALSQADVEGGTLQNNGAGVWVFNGGMAKVINVTIQHNGTGIEVRAHGFVNTSANITNNTGTGVLVTHNGTLNCPGCRITGNGVLGVILRRNSSARIYGDYEITDNTGGGVLLSEESSAYFPNAGVVKNNPGGKDVFCGASSATAKYATTNIGGGTTNCVEPTEP